MYGDMLYVMFALITTVSLPLMLFIEVFIGYNEFPGLFQRVGFTRREVGLVTVGAMVGLVTNVPILVYGDSLMMLNLDITDSNAFPPESPLITFVVPRHPAARGAFRRAKEITLPASALTFPFDT